MFVCVKEKAKLHSSLCATIFINGNSVQNDSLSISDFINKIIYKYKIEHFLIKHKTTILSFFSFFLYIYISVKLFREINSSAFILIKKT